MILTEQVTSDVFWVITVLSLLVPVGVVAAKELYLLAAYAPVVGSAVARHIKVPSLVRRGADAALISIHVRTTSRQFYTAATSGRYLSRNWINKDPIVNNCTFSIRVKQGNSIQVAHYQKFSVEA